MSKLLEPILYGIVRNLWQQQWDAHKHPCVAKAPDIYVELRKLSDSILEQMVSDGILVRSQNVNGIQMYAIRRPPKQDCAKKPRR